MNLLKKIFRTKEKRKAEDSKSNSPENTELSGLEKFKSKNADNRLRDIMILGDTGHPNAYDVLEYAIQNDSDSGVVMAALKRIHNFQENNKVIPFLTKLNDTQKMDVYEPYFSMALSRTGIITIEEFENKINGTTNG